jgi:hypothetical protein
MAPSPNPCQLFPIATHCRFKPFQALSRSRKGEYPVFDGFGLSKLSNPNSKKEKLMARAQLFALAAMVLATSAAAQERQNITQDYQPTYKLTVHCDKEVLTIDHPSRRWDTTKFRCDKDGGVWIVN